MKKIKKTRVSPKTGTKKAGREKKKYASQPVPRLKKATARNKNIQPFPIVGIGGSAGGMEAFSLLLENLPSNLGMAYVYIQHLSPNYESFLPQILQRKTKMPVVKIRDNMPVEKDHVYVMPEKNSIAIVNGKLKLRKIENRTTIHSIDYFFNSLAPLYQQNAIGIVLSGTGTDGSLGLMSIKAEGGITFAQDNSATYTSMPHHAADMGYVDFVMPPDKIAGELASLIRHPYSVTSANDFLLQNKNELRKIHMLMHSKRDVDFSHYKQTTIHRRILRRMALNKLKDLESYYALLKEDKTELDALYQDLLITVTNFFREPLMYDALVKKVLPALLKNRRQNDPLRIWIPGCATGEEAVSFAITLIEYLGEKAMSMPVQIFATDLNEKTIEKARAGLYLKSALQNVSPRRLRRFFVKTNGKYQVIKPIRDMCIYAPHNLLKDPPFSRMDIISCQNVLIYLEATAQNRIMHAFHYSLKPNGFLVLGKSETIGNASDLFEQVSKSYKVYSKRMVNGLVHLDWSPRTYIKPADHDDDSKISKHPIKEMDLEKETDKLLLSRFVPASVLVNKDLEILRFRGPTSRFIEPASGKASLHLMKMIKEDLAFDLRTVIFKAKKEGRDVSKEGIHMTLNGIVEEVSIEVIPLKSSGRDSYFLIVFKEHPRPPELKTDKQLFKGTRDAKEKRIQSLENQLKEARDSIKIVSEDFEGTREELQSANEEILSSNEELQSINEELETSKEELQSSNEELTTINEELQIRNNELKEAGDYAQAIVETMHESLLMLSSDLKVKNANKGFYQTFQVTPEETEGRSLFELGNGQWDQQELRKHFKMVQSRDIPFFNLELTHDFPQIGKKTMILNAQKVSLREGNDSLIIFAIQDMTERKQMEESLQEKEEQLRVLIQNSSDIITVFDRDGTIKFESPAITSVLGYEPKDRIGRNINMDPIIHPADRPILFEVFRKAVASSKKNIYGEFRLMHKDGHYRSMEAIFRNVIDNNRIQGIIANYRDITDIKSQQSRKVAVVVEHEELMQPLSMVRGFAAQLKKELEPQKTGRSIDLVSKLSSEIEELNRMISEMVKHEKEREL